MSYDALLQSAQAYAAAHETEALTLLKALGRIPAPSHHEEKRAAFCHEWLLAQGARDAYIDDALNVVFPFHCMPGQPMVAIMAHTDIVFPDTEPLNVTVSEGKIFAPGIGDDTANLVSLLMAVKFAVQSGFKPNTGILFVANSCEEGLGNLKGCRAIFDRYGTDIREFISFDGSSTGCVNKAVGSHRYRVSIKTGGGHSYGMFGAPNAIAQLAEVICALYEKEVPAKAKTTYNVGQIEGGTTVNSIAEKASMLYEFRSEDKDCLAEMEAFFLETLDAFRARGYQIEAETLGIRPCSGDVDAEKLAALTNRAVSILAQYTNEPIDIHASSTDANIPLSLGIPAITYGTILGEGAHTYGEWVELASLPNGLRIALQTILHYLA